MSENGKKPKELDVILALARDGAKFFLTPKGEPWATVKVEKDGLTHFAHWPLYSPGFQTWLSGHFYALQKRGATPVAVKESLSTLDAMAHAGKDVHDLRVRIGEKDGQHYIDLSDSHWRALKIEADSRAISKKPAVYFSRSKGMLPFTVPQKPTEEHPGDLRRFLNVSDEDFLLVQAFILQALKTTEQYPILILTGEQGSSKSVIARMLGKIIDPSDPQIQGKPTDIQNLMVAANNSHLLIFDNLSGIKEEMSDALCSLSSGAGFRKRQLYSDFAESSFSGSRPIILAGIGDIATRPDLLDRSMVIELPNITEETRRKENEIWADFNTELPFILGRLLETFQLGLERLPTTEVKNLTRMAEFMEWGVACLGNDFNLAYRRNQHEKVTAIALEASPIVETLLDAVRHPSVFEGTAADLLDLLELVLDGKRPAYWPKGHSALGKEIRRVAPSLRAVGHTVEFPAQTNQGRRIVFQPCQPFTP